MVLSPPERSRSSRPAVVEVSPVDPLKGTEWDSMLASHPDRTVFHHSAWARVLHRTYGHQPCYFSCRKDGRVVALVPVMEVSSVVTGRRGVSLPFSDFCTPLFFSADHPVRETVAEALNSLARERGWRHWEIRGGDGPAEGGHPYSTYLSHSLCLLDGSDALFSRFDPAVRRAIRKAESGGLTVSVRTDREAMAAYYGLHVRTRRRHGLPPQPLAFFLNIHREIMEQGLGFIALVARGNQPVAGTVFFHTGPRAIYKFGACDERFMDLRANNLAMWNGIKAVCSLGCETLSFGRTDRGHDGLRRYKQGWGTTEATLQYYRDRSSVRKSAANAESVSGTASAFFSRLPLPVNRLLGRLIYPHLD